MGFTAGLYSYPKYEGITQLQRDLISETLAYETSSWAQEHFDNAKLYAYYATELKEEDVPYPSKEIIEFFRDHRTPDEFGKLHIFKEYAMWCSNGSGEMYEWFDNLGKENTSKYGLHIELTKEDIVHFMNFCWSQIEKVLPIECELKYAYKYIPAKNEDGEEDWEEDPEIKMIPCDGIELTFEDGATRRIDGGSGLTFMFPKTYGDTWMTNGYIYGIQACMNILANVDFEHEVVYYSGGW